MDDDDDGEVPDEADVDPQYQHFEEEQAPDEFNMPVETGNSQDEDDNGLNAAIDMAEIDENVEEVDEDSFSIPDESESTHRQSILQQLNLVD